MTVKEKINKSWNNKSFHETYESADSARNKLLNIWAENEQHKGMQVKVKRMSQRYVVKTRLHPDFEEPKPINKKKEKKRGKDSRRNREAAAKRELNAATTVWKISSFSFPTISGIEGRGKFKWRRQR